MLRKTALLALVAVAMTACSSDKPHIIQTSLNSTEVLLTEGMATQIEVPEAEHVKSAVTGNPNLVATEMSGNIVTLVPKNSTGQTNLIIRTTDEDKNARMYEYRLTVQEGDSH
jgi:hypothetical protein